MASATTSQTTPRARSRATAVARAYGGPSHGQRWPIADADPPEEFNVAPDNPVFRLIHHPRTHQLSKEARRRPPLVTSRPGSVGFTSNPPRRGLIEPGYRRR